jgi:hypothetical protein
MFNQVSKLNRPKSQHTPLWTNCNVTPEIGYLSVLSFVGT